MLRDADQRVIGPSKSQFHRSRWFCLLSLARRFVRRKTIPLVVRTPLVHVVQRFVYLESRFGRDAMVSLCITHARRGFEERGVLVFPRWYPFRRCRW